MRRSIWWGLAVRLALTAVFAGLGLVLNGITALIQPYTGFSTAFLVLVVLVSFFLAGQVMPSRRRGRRRA